MSEAIRTVTVSTDAKGVAVGLRIPRYRVKVLSGPNRGLDRVVSAVRVVVGSQDGADILLDDKTVSAVHCELVLDRGGLRVADLDSKNGVLLGGRRVLAAYLEHKDELTLGGTRLRVQWEDSSEVRPVGPRTSMGRMRGGSLAMREVYDTLEKVAGSDAPVLITGETGTGKELAVAALVEAGSRREAPFVIVDCGALASTLAESELFGHEKGAFTSAETARAGAFERANGGTLFLDEIAELPPHLQTKLLGVLGRREVVRLGGAAPIPVDVRVVSATHVEIERAVNRGAFRADLFFRLSALRVHLPPLRERREDIPDLVAHFLEASGATKGLAPAMLEALYRGDWPGNVRELRNAVERAVVGVVDPPAPAPRLESLELDRPFRTLKREWTDAFERSYLKQLYEAAGGNVSEAARRSRIDRVHLYRLFKRHGVGEKS